MKDPKKSRPIRIGLLTPYNGANLGDGAIQEAVITNIKVRYPDACIHGFTLNPEATGRLHNITCSPLTALPLLHYWAPTPSKAFKVSSQERERTRFLQGVKNVAKTIPFAYSLLKGLRRWATATSYLMAEFQLVWQGYRMLKDFDLLIVSGGGQLDDYWGGAWGHPFALFKWALIARATGTDYLFLSVGTCTFKSRLSVMFVKWALQMASYRSYRDEISKKLLEHFTFTHNDPVCPDLAFSYDMPANKKLPSGRKGKTIVGISPIAYLSSYYWPKRDLKIYASYMASLTTFVSSLLRDDFSVIFFHTSGTDKFVVEELLESLQKDNLIEDTDNVEVVATKKAEDLLTLMSGVDIVVASRLHGVMLSHLMNRPVLAISYDRKVTTYMQDVGQGEFCLDIHHIDPQLLINTFLALSLKQELVKDQIAKKTTEFKQSLSIQFDEILNCHGQTGR
jgi:polysaccharide pyruvyl transferase WcaK-like protein